MIYNELLQLTEAKFGAVPVRFIIAKRDAERFRHLLPSEMEGTNSFYFLRDEEYIVLKLAGAEVYDLKEIELPDDEDISCKF